MKKICVIVLSFVLAFSALFSIPVTAAPSTYDISALGVKVELAIPEGYDVITRDTPSNDPIFSKLGTTSSVVFDEFEGDGIYLKAISADNIVVTVSEHVLKFFDLLSAATVHEIISPLKERYNNSGLKILKYRSCRNTQVPFLEISFTDPARKLSALQYYTVYNGRAVSFILYSASDRLDEKQENVLKNVVNHARISNTTTVTGPKEDAEAFQYTDADTGVAFTVPANWKQKEFNEERELLDAKFVPTKEDGCTMIYGSIDMWGQMSAADRVGCSRSDINNSAFTKQDVAEMYGTTVDKISTTTYNGVQYFVGEINTSSGVYGVDVSTTQLVCIDNGWMYLFQFSDTGTHQRYSDFEKLLNSVKYPNVSNAEATEPSKPVTSVPDHSKQGFSSASGVIAIVALLVIVPVIVVAVVVTRKRNKKTINQSDYSTNNNAPETKPVSHAEKVVVCKKCGQMLPSDSVFCHFCGTRIEKEP